MKTVDINVGEVYATEKKWPIYGAKVKVLEKGVERRSYSYSKPTKGVRVEVLQDGPRIPISRTQVGEELVLLPRQIWAVWNENHEAARQAVLDNAAAFEALDARAGKFGGRAMRGGGVSFDDGDAVLTELERWTR